MIKVQDWVASIPDEDKHVAYVGEGMSETREFCLCGEGWEAYRNWSFHLDMAFDPESITTRESRQVVQTHSHSSQMKEEAAVNTEESETKETYTVENEEVLDYNLTDIAPLEKRVGEDGIYLTWTVLRQHTVLPGKLWATLRAVDGTAQKVKKSAIMVFEVDAAICAVPAARPSISEMEQIEARVAQAADTVTYGADRAEAAVTQSLNNVYLSQAHAADSQAAKERAQEYAMVAEGMYQSTVNQAATAEEHKWAALEAAEQAQACVTQAQEQAAKAEKHCGQASDCADRASEAGDAAVQAAASAAVSAEGAANAVNKCSHYVIQCADFAEEAEALTQTVENLTYRRINVRDMGAVGDGVTDDRGAILAAFAKAKTMLPCEVYFPAGTYGISNGMYFKMPLGSGGLRVRGAGRDTTTIQYLDSFPDSGQNWYALAIAPETSPAKEDEYLHDVSVMGLTIHDPDPCAKAWALAKGDPGQEETHGFGLNCIKRCSVTDCQVITAGDESINIYDCHDVIVMNNHLVGCPGAGPGGGAIAICDGSVGVVVSNNTINGSAPDEVLENGTVIEKHNTGIEVESMEHPVRDVIIANNTVLNIQGTGIGMYAGSAGCGVYNVSIADNLVAGCNNGIDDSGFYPKESILISGNNISDCRKLHGGNGHGIYLYGGGNTDIVVRGNTIRNTDAWGVYVASEGNDAVVEGNTIKNTGAEAVYVDGGAMIRDCTIRNTGMGESKGNAAITPYGGATIRVYGCRLTGVRQAKGIEGAIEVEDTAIEMVDADGNPVTDAAVFGSSAPKRVVNCQVAGYINITKANAVVQGVTLNCSQQYQPAIKVSASGVIVTGCHITHTKSNDCIKENGAVNHNLFANNVVNSAITTVGAQSVSVNNVNTSVTV